MFGKTATKDPPQNTLRVPDGRENRPNASSSSAHCVYAFVLRHSGPARRFAWKHCVRAIYPVAGP